MSVALIVLEPKSIEYAHIYVPIATEDVFRRVWIPAVEKINAVWIPLFQIGVDITSEDFENVIQELISLREWVRIHEQDQDEIQQVLFRIDLLLNELKRLSIDTNGDITVFIG